MDNDLISRSAVLRELMSTKITAAKYVNNGRISKDTEDKAVVIADLFAEMIQKLPVVDAVPVVRCRDCIHAVAITNLTIANRCGLGQKNCMRQRGDDGFGFAGVSVVYPDGFCDEGERMDGEAE